MRKRLLFALALALTALANVPSTRASSECTPPSACIDPEGYCLCRAQGQSHLGCMKNCTTP